ncbi:MAG: hypothetical protein R3286_11130 [Gammaproteobacteria bacterium]|nr:hypothetical protein [Gammaproteobacteria bacterium]
MSDRPPRRAGRLEPAEFGVAFQIAIDAGEGRGDIDADALAGSPYERAARALADHFGVDSDKHESATLRFRALMDLYSRKALGPWVRETSRAGGTDIHPAVLDVASRMRLGRSGRFPARKFLDEVAKVARERYADLAEWPLDDE